MYSKSSPVLRLTILVVITYLALHGIKTSAQSILPSDTGGQIFLPMVSTGTASQDNSVQSDIIPNQYIVVFHDNLVTAASAATIASELAATYNGELLYVYDMMLYGFAMRLPADTASSTLSVLQQDPRIAYIEPDRLLRLPEAKTIQVTDSQAIENQALSTLQLNPHWNLDRIDQRNRPIDHRYDFANDGTGVRVYIIDTGIRFDHSEFEGRAVNGYNVLDHSLSATDCHGHGTFVAGVVGGKTYGVAKKVTLVAVRAFECNGTSPASTVIDGIKWVIEQRRANPRIPAVVNISAGSELEKIKFLDQNVRNLINVGVTVVVSAGNTDRDACKVSPANVTSAITVGATDAADIRARFDGGGRSNFGPCLDLFAPGHDVLSADYSGSSASKTWEGTSFAAPHVAGVAALYLQTNPSASPAEVADFIKNNATPNIVGDAGSDSPANLLYNPPSGTGGSQKIAITSYFYPGSAPGTVYWAQLIKGAPTVAIAIINPDSGVGDQVDSGYQTLVNTLRNSGIKAIGYVDTDYGQRSTTIVKEEIARYISWYGVRDIMLARTPRSDCTKLNYYQEIYNYIRAQTTNATVVIDPGGEFDKCFMNIGSDLIAISFLDTYNAYKNWRPPSWTVNYPPTRFWHIVTGTSLHDLADAIARSKQNRAGYVYVTPNIGDAANEIFPPKPYWQKELNFVKKSSANTATDLSVMEELAEAPIDETEE